MNRVLNTPHYDKLIVQEVAPRDGLQIEPTWVDTPDKIALINALSTVGFTRIEAGSFVSPKAIPALRDGEAVFQQIERQPGVIYVALIPNLKGAERAPRRRTLDNRWCDCALYTPGDRGAVDRRRTPGVLAARRGRG